MEKPLNLRLNSLGRGARSALVRALNHPGLEIRGSRIIVAHELATLGLSQPGRSPKSPPILTPAGVAHAEEIVRTASAETQRIARRAAHRSARGTEPPIPRGQAQAAACLDRLIGFIASPTAVTLTTDLVATDGTTCHVRIERSGSRKLILTVRSEKSLSGR